MASASIPISQTPPTARVALAVHDAHRRQRELVRASLVCRPLAGRSTHRRWA